MSGTIFLVGEEQGVVDKYRLVFDEAVNAAKGIAGKGARPFYEIVEVRFYTQQEGQIKTEEGSWSPDDTAKTATIALKGTADPECITHEVFHSVFHPSPLHDRHNEDKTYGDKFCNGFRYSVNPSKGKHWMPNDGSPYDAHGLIARCPDLATFSSYFVGLCNKKRQDLGKRILDAESI